MLVTSYFGHMASVTVRYGDMIPSYKDNSSGDFSEWIKKVELVAKLKKVDELHTFLPLFLAGPAFAVYMQLTDAQQADYDVVKDTLTAAFCASPFSAYDELQKRQLQAGESPDVYLADIRRLISLTGCKEVPDAWVRCAFIGGLPSSARAQLTAMAEATTMSLPDLLARTRTVLSVGEREIAGAAGSVSNVYRSEKRAGTPKRKCFKCG